MSRTVRSGGYKIEEQTRKMLNTIRLLKEDVAHKKEVTETEEDINEFPITKHTRNFGDVRTSQEEALVKVIGEDVKFTEEALVYTWKNNGSNEDASDNLILTGTVTAQNIVFEFRYHDTSGDGCYIWAEKLQLSDKNIEIVNKIKSGYSNWKDGILQNSGDLLNKLNQTVKNK